MTTIVDLMDLTIMKLTAAMAMTMFLVGTEKKAANMFAMTTMLFARLVMVTMVMVTTVIWHC